VNYKSNFRPTPCKIWSVIFSQPACSNIRLNWKQQLRQDARSTALHEDNLRVTDTQKYYEVHATNTVLFISAAAAELLCERIQHLAVELFVLLALAV